MTSSSRSTRPASTRDLRLDSLRGLALVVMAVNHMDGRLQNSTYQAVGFVSAAEWFVFLSGLVAGLVYMRRWENHGPGSVWARCARRAGQLYLYHILTFLAVLLLGWYSLGLAESWRLHIPHYGYTPLLDHRLLAVGLGLALIYQPTFLDILPMYAILVLLLPALLWCLRKRCGGWVLLALSFGLWWYAQGRPAPDFGFEFPGHLKVRKPYFHLTAWQLLFVLGVVLGSLRARCLTARPAVGGLLRVLVLPAALLALSLLLIRWNVIPVKKVLALFDLRAGTHIPSLAWLRMVNFTAQAILVAWVGRRLPALLTWPPLAFLGRHALQVYTAHLVVIFLGAAWMPEFSYNGWLQELLCTGIMIATLYAAAYAHEAFMVRLRDRLSPSEDAAPEFPSPEAKGA